jgi:hypothetical protein
MMPASKNYFTYDLGVGQLPDRLLICVVYYVENAKYREAFLTASGGWASPTFTRSVGRRTSTATPKCLSIRLGG